MFAAHALRETRVHYRRPLPYRRIDQTGVGVLSVPQCTVSPRTDCTRVTRPPVHVTLEYNVPSSATCPPGPPPPPPPHTVP